MSDVYPTDEQVRRAMFVRAATLGSDPPTFISEFDAMRAALIAAEQAAWLPIESAPTNTSILIWVQLADHYGPGIYRAFLVDMGTGKRWHCTALHMGRDISGEWLPTHWRPLPAVPGPQP